MKQQFLKALLGILLFAPLMFGACAKEEEGAPESTAARPERVLRTAESRVPSTLNGQRTPYLFDLLRLSTGNLYQWIIDEETQWHTWVEDLADGPPIEETALASDHTVWTLKIKPGFTFYDGTPIDAHTFEYTHKMMMDPTLLNRNNALSELVNGEEYTSGDCEWEDFGYKVIDDYTFRITYRPERAPVNVTEVMNTFDGPDTGLVHPEMFESCYNADRTENDYGSTLEKFVASGAYRPTSWTADQYYEIEKWRGGSPLVDEIWTADKIQIRYVTDVNTQVQLFMNGEIDQVNARTAQFDDYPGLIPVYNSSNSGIFLNALNPRNPIVKDKNFRYAIYWAINREFIARDIWRTNVPNARQNTLISKIFDPEDPSQQISYYDWPGAKELTLDGHPLTENGYDAELAREYFQKAYDANGGQKVTMEMKYSDNTPEGKRWAEYVQNSLQELFGIDRLELNLQAVPWEAVYEDMRRDTMNYDMMAAGGIFTDFEGRPWNNTNWTYIEPDYTYSTQYCILTEEARVKFDELFLKCMEGEWKFDEAAKNDASVAIDQVLMDDMTFVPIYSGGLRLLVADHLKPILRVGHPDLGAALWQAEWVE